jgi:hypothetical protein
MFMAFPYNLPPKISTILAQICCYENQLPQGAPTSPIVSNMVCARLDSQLQQLARKYKCYYTRYADDITFSTSISHFPAALARVYSDSATPYTEVGSELEQVIKQNGFEVNKSKTRLQKADRHQEITGLTVNEFPNVSRSYVNNIRAMLHAWEKYGYENAARRFAEIHQDEKKTLAEGLPPFKTIVRGKIEFLRSVRGSSNSTYKKLATHLAALDPEFKPFGEIEKEADKGGAEKHLFISYSHSDQEFAFKLVNALEACGANIWIDESEILGGTSWMDEIGKGLDTCHLLLLIISPEALKSHYVKYEWSYCIGIQKTIIPLLYKNVETLPFPLNSIHHIDFKKSDFHSAFEVLRRSLERAGVILKSD